MLLRHGEVAFVEEGGRGFVLVLDGVSSNPFELSESALAIWHAVGEGATRELVADGVATLYEGTDAVALRDGIDAGIGLLVARGILVEAESIY